MNHNKLTGDSKKAALPILLLSGVLLAGCNVPTQAENNDTPHYEPTSQPLPKNVLGETYTEQGTRVVMFNAENPTILLQVTETCDQGNLVSLTERVKAIGDKDGDGDQDYSQRTNTDIKYNDPSCEDDAITPADKRPIPTPAPEPVQPNETESTRPPSYQDI